MCVFEGMYIQVKGIYQAHDVNKYLARINIHINAFQATYR